MTTIKESRIVDGKNDYLKITFNGGFRAEYKFDFVLMKCFIFLGFDYFPYKIKPYIDKQDMLSDIEGLRKAA